MSHLPEKPEKSEKSEKTEKSLEKHASTELTTTKKAKTAEEDAPEEKYFEPGEPLLAAVAECQYHGAPEVVEYLDKNTSSTVSAAHQYAMVRFTLTADKIPTTPPDDPLNPPPPPKDRVYEVAGQTLIERPGDVVMAMENAGMIVHPTQAEIDEAKAREEHEKARKEAQVEAEKAQKKLQQEHKKLLTAHTGAHE